MNAVSKCVGTRQGVVLLVVLGITFLMTGLVLSLLIKARLDAAQTTVVGKVSQARMMLGAACAYVQECSRIGWKLDQNAWDYSYDNNRDPPRTRPSWKLSLAQECFGWVDVRDGTVGPRTHDYDGVRDAVLFQAGPFSGQAKHDECSDYDRRYDNMLVEDSNDDGLPDRPAWPAINGVARCPMAVMQRPPYAINLTLTPNPIEADPSNASRFGLPLLKNPDPMPELGLSATDAAALPPSQRWQRFSQGDTSPRDAGGSHAWFRVLRDGPATFVVTCGAGASQGFRDWKEVRGLGATALFHNDQALFADIMAEETRLWYRLEWSAAV